MQPVGFHFFEIAIEMKKSDRIYCPETEAMLSRIL
jgi:hypothetical protein